MKPLTKIEIDLLAKRAQVTVPTVLRWAQGHSGMPDKDQALNEAMALLNANAAVVHQYYLMCHANAVDDIDAILTRADEREYAARVTALLGFDDE